MPTFDAVAIEHTLARFFRERVGARDTPYDADVFRTGKPEDLAMMLRIVADRLRERTESIRFAAKGPESAQAQLETCASLLNTLADRIKDRKQNEPEDYHWEVFGALMMAIEGLFEQLEA